MALFNSDSMIGIIITQITNNLTGSLFLTLLFLCMVLIAIAGAFRLPMELTIPMIIPFLLIAVIVTNQILIVFGVALIYLAIVLTKRFFF